MLTSGTSILACFMRLTTCQYSLGLVPCEMVIGNQLNRKEIYKGMQMPVVASLGKVIVKVFMNIMNSLLNQLVGWITLVGIIITQKWTYAMN